MLLRTLNRLRLLAFDIDCYGVRIRGFDLLAMRERLAVDGSLLRVC